MRVIEAFDKPILAMAASPDGRFLAALSRQSIRVYHWSSHEIADQIDGLDLGGIQLAFTPDGHRLLYLTRNDISQLRVGRSLPRRVAAGEFAGGLALSPDGKTLVATRAGQRQHVQLERWELPSGRKATGFDFWSPFVKLAFSPNGEFLAGIDRDSFELRFAITGGLNARQRLPGWSHTLFVAFHPDSQMCVFGRDAEFQIMETRAGHMLGRVSSPGPRFIDAAFLGSGRQLATVDGTSVMRIWSTDSRQIVREYDWATGGLTGVASSADGMAGICGTDTGRLVVFDVDE